MARKTQSDLLKQATKRSQELGLSEDSRLKIEQQILDNTTKSTIALEKHLDLLIKIEAKERVRVGTSQKLILLSFKTFPST